MEVVAPMQESPFVPSALRKVFGTMDPMRPVPHPEPPPDDATPWMWAYDDCALCPAAARTLWIAVLFDDAPVIGSLVAADPWWSEAPGVVQLFLCFHHSNELEPRLRRWNRPAPGGLRAGLPGWSADVGRWVCAWDIRMELIQREWASTHLPSS